MIAYPGEPFRVFGPQIIYALKKGAIAINLHANVAGDNYKAYELRARENAWHGGVSVRVFFLTLRYGGDISNTHNGSIARVGGGHRFKVSENFTVIPSITREFLSRTFVDYYYGVDADEVGTFSQYDTANAADSVYAIRMSYKINERNSLMLSLRHRVFDKIIHESPTIALRSFNTWGFFWNYAL
jgi:outer membrane scaffolding protein for murein synthesis (MipA/OmpV family)